LSSKVTKFLTQASLLSLKMRYAHLRKSILTCESRKEGGRKGRRGNGEWRMWVFGGRARE
jgi:hypothetical protein